MTFIRIIRFIAPLMAGCAALALQPDPLATPANPSEPRQARATPLDPESRNANKPRPPSDPTDPESCGTRALLALARAAQRTGTPHPALDRTTIPSCETLAELGDAARRLGVAAQPAQRLRPGHWTAPCIVHWRVGHFSALIDVRAHNLLLDDPLLGGRIWCDARWLDSRTSGYFLVPEPDLDDAWRTLDPSEAAAITGGQRIYPPRLYDDDDEECPTDEEITSQPMDPNAPSPGEIGACPPPDTCPPGYGEDGCDGYGMPVWRVSEPLINLWIKDTPLYYTMSNGRIMPFVLRYKQRAAPTSTNVFGFGNSWECSWLSYVDEREGGVVEYRVPGGGKRRYDRARDGAMRGSRGEVAGVATSADGSVSYYLAYRSFNANSLGQTFPGTETNTLHLLTEKRDPHGRVIRFVYATNETTILLTRVVDYDGKVCELSYTNKAFPRFVTSVRDPYGRQAHLQYDTNGHLVRIVDMAGITNAFRYDRDGFLDAMITPYGTTRFRTWAVESTDDALPTSRSIEVTLPNGQRQVYAYHNSLETTQVPDYYTDSPRVEDEVPEPVAVGPLNRRGSFFWNSPQLALVTNDWPEFNPEHYRLARWRHWDVSYHTGPRLGTRLLLERAPSPDGSAEGHRRWFTYFYDAFNDVQTVWPSQAAERLPDGSVRYRRWQRNEWGLPVTIESTYGDGPDVAVRQTWLAYDATGCNLAEVYGPELDAWQWPILTRAYAYNPNAQITNVVNALGETLSATYHPTNRNLTSIAYPFGLRLTNQLATEGFLTRKVWSTAAGAPIATNTFEWDKARLLAHTDARGFRVTHSWDLLGRLTGLGFPDGTTVSNWYTKIDGVPFPESTGGLKLLDLTRTKDRLGHSTFFTYNPLGQLVAATNALGHVHRYSWCNCGALESVTDPLGNTTTYDRDLQGRLTAIHHPDNSHIRAAYDELGRLTNVTDSLTALTLEYNHQGLLQRVAQGTTVIQKIDYDPVDRPRSVEDAAGTQYDFGYDSLGRLIRRTERQTQASEWLGYTPGLPWPTSYTNQLGSSVVLLAYDALGQLTSQIQGALEGEAFRGLTTNRFTYSPAGDLLSLVDGLGRRTAWVYDTPGRPIRKLDSLNRVAWTNAFDANNRLLVHWTPARSNLTTCSYDALGRLTKADFSNPTTVDLTFTYDPAGRLVQATDAVGTTRLTWTATGSLAAEDGPWIDDTVSLDRDATLALRTLSLAQPGSTAWVQTNAYDSLGRLSRTASPAGQFDYAYRGIQPFITSISRLQGAVITREHDDLGRLLDTALLTPQAAVLNRHHYEYDLTHQRVRQSFVAGNTLDYAYDPLGQLISATGREADRTARQHEQFSFRYDAAGNLLQRTNGTTTINVTVNSLNQLVAETRAGSVLVAGMASPSATNVTVNGQAATLYQDRTFARPGIAVPETATTLTAVARDALGRSASDAVTVALPGTATFACDGNGNLQRDGRRLFTFDDRDQLVALIVTNSTDASTLSEFLYDAFGRRRIRREKVWHTNQWVQRDEIRYVYAGGLVLQERGADNLPRVTYTRGPDLGGDFQEAGGIGGLLAMTLHHPSGAAHYYSHADGSGNITALIDARHNVVARYHYDPFGQLAGLTGPLAETNLIRFSSKEFHPASGLVYYGFRFYDPNLQRWINRDPLGETDDPNLYRPLLNDLINNVDPWGLQSRPMPAHRPPPDPIEVELIANLRNGGWIENLRPQTRARLLEDLRAHPTGPSYTEIRGGNWIILPQPKPQPTPPSAPQSLGNNRPPTSACSPRQLEFPFANDPALGPPGSRAGKSTASLLPVPDPWPPENGFKPGTVHRTCLMPGEMLDRFGGEYGYFVAPLGTPLGARSMRPGSEKAEYHKYRVLKPFEVQAGITAPWFFGYGGGTQYMLPVRLRYLIERGILERADE